MTIQVGYFTGEKMKVNKKVTLDHKYDNCTLKGSVNMEHPVLVIQTSAAGAKNLKNATYCYIPDFGRYYFIESTDSNRANLVTVNCNVDPLKTYEDKIYAQTCLVRRTASKKASAWLKDERIPVYANPKILTRKLEPVTGDGLTEFSITPSYVLITAGPGETDA